jgi:hypothetical protein
MPIGSQATLTLFRWRNFHKNCFYFRRADRLQALCGMGSVRKKSLFSTA